MSARFEKDFNEQFADIAETARPYNKHELKTLNEFQQGERDCLNGLAKKDGQSTAYYEGYEKEGLNHVK